MTRTTITTRDDDTSDGLAAPREAVATAIMALQAFQGTAGSPEMRAVTMAIDYLGCAYSTLRTDADNPAWER